MNMTRSSSIVGPILTILLCAQPGISFAEEAEEELEAPRRIEWIIDGSLTVVWLSMLPALFIDTNTDATIGPSFRGPEDVGELEAAVAAGRIDRPFHEEETLSDEALVYALVGMSLGSLAIGYGLAPWIDSEDHSGRWFGEQLLNTTLGMFHAMFGSYMLTQLAKVASGRLRPDFADRADRYYCYQNSLSAAYQSRCDGLEASGELGPEGEERDIIRGRRSFWSGHASMSFAAATYAALLIGGRMVWNDGATALTRTLGIVLQGASLATAAFIAGSRVSDGVHHIEDVLTGAVVGISMACLGYFLHFDLSGEVRRGVSLSVAPRDDGVALAAMGQF